MSWNTTEWNGGIQIGNNKTGGFGFTLSPGAHINAVQTGRPALREGMTISLTYAVKAIKGKPIFLSLDPSNGLKPNFRPMIQVKNDDYMGQDNRWWPSGMSCVILQPKLALAAGTFLVPLKPQLWTNVWGKPATSRRSGWLNTLLHPGNLNIVFGGGNSFSHGVAVKGGSVRFILQKWSIK